MVDPLAVAREALQAIIDRHHPATDHHGDYCEECCGPPFPCPDREAAERALVALEAADAAQAERDDKIRQHAWAVRHGHTDCGNCERGFICPEVEHAEAILVLVGEPTMPADEETKP